MKHACLVDILRFKLGVAEVPDLCLGSEDGTRTDSKSDNVPLYEHLGFRVETAADAPQGGPHVWFMRFDP